MKTVRIARNVIVAGKIHKKGDVVEVADEHVEHLVKGEHAVETAGPSRKGGKGNLPEKLEDRTLPELWETVDAWNADNPKKKIELPTNSKKEQIITALMKAAGYEVK